MAEPLRTEEIPSFDTYPGPESREAAAGGSTLHSAAEQIGGTVGRAVRAARGLPERVDQVATDLRDRMTVIRGGRSASAGDRASELKEVAQQKLEDGKQRAAQLARQLRARAARVADERPLYVLLAIFVGGVIAGVSLRLWRNRD